jgi:peptidoglycan/xylan/chitin deacetylase (PgdA/CDA1 family)
MYHSITKKAVRDWGPWKYAVTPSEFREQIRWLTRHTTVVSIDDLVAYLSGEGLLPKNAAVITFDDGYRDYVQQAVPVLEEFEVPSTVYVSTQLMEDQVAPYEFRLAEMLYQQERVEIEFDGERLEYELSGDAETKRAYAEIRRLVKGSAVKARRSLVAQIGSTDVDEYTIVTTEMVEQLGTNPLVTVGSHGHEHRPLGELSNEDVETSIQQSNQILSDTVGNPIDHFSFPYGSTSPFAVRTVERLGYESGVTTESRWVKPRDWNRCYRIPRVDMSTYTNTTALEQQFYLF